MDDVIVVEGLCKDYGSIRAVDDLSFTIGRGEVFALLGPNGAGKTTTVEILEGHRNRTPGRVSVLGFDPATGGRAYRDRIGIVLQEAGFDEEFTVRELVTLYASLYSHRRDVDEVIERVGLTDKATSRTKTLSGGQRRRLDLALGLVGDPELLFLDEPTTGLRPVGPAAGLGPHRLAARPRHDHRAHDALHGGGRAPRRPRGGHPSAGAWSRWTPRRTWCAPRARAAVITFVLPDGRRAGGPPVDRRRGARDDGQQSTSSRRSDARPPRADRVGGRAGRRARGPDADPADARGRVPGPHGGRGERRVDAASVALGAALLCAASSATPTAGSGARRSRRSSRSCSP